jgi:hypothetical protein
MERIEAASVEFSLGFCTACDRDVLTHVHFDDDGSRLCVHCDAPVHGAVRAATLNDLKTAGYGEIPPASSCGSGGCGSGGCSRG